MQKEDFGQQMMESQQQFRKQFDPTSDSFHGGAKTLVPLGGERIPQSMPTTYPENFDPNQAPQQIDYGPDYKKVQADRKIYLDLKKSLAKLGPVLQSFIRHQEMFKQKGDPKNEQHIKSHQAKILKQKQNLKLVQEQLQVYLPKLQLIGEDGKLNSSQLKTIVIDSNKKYDNKQSLTDFNFKIKKLSTKIFADAQKCLQSLKDIKKNYKKQQPKKQQEPNKQQELKKQQASKKQQ